MAVVGTSTLRDTFGSTNLLINWPNSTGTVIGTGTVAQVQCDTTYDNELATKPIYSIKNDKFDVKLATLPAAAGATSSCYVQVAVIQTGGANFIALSIDTTTNMVYCRFTYADAVAPQAYNATWTRVRIREGTASAGNLATGTVGTTYFDVATANDEAHWTNIGSGTTPAWVSTTGDSGMSITAHRDTGTVNVAVVDNVNVTLPGAPTLGSLVAGDTQATVNLDRPGRHRRNADHRLPDQPGPGPARRVTVRGVLRFGHLGRGPRPDQLDRLRHQRAGGQRGRHRPDVLLDRRHPAQFSVTPGRADLGGGYRRGRAGLDLLDRAHRHGDRVHGDRVPAPATGAATRDTGSTIAAYTFTGLTNGTPYTFTVVARNSAGSSAASAPSAAVTPVAAVVTTNPSITTLVDGFDGTTVNPALWNVLGDPLGISEGGGNLSIAAEPNSVFNQITSINAYDLTGVGCVLHFAALPAADGSQTTVVFESGTPGTDLRFVVVPGPGADLSTTTVTATVYSGYVDVGTPAVATVDATRGLWLRLSESGGTLSWAYSFDGLAWTPIPKMVSTPSWAKGVHLTVGASNASNSTVIPPGTPPPSTFTIGATGLPGSTLASVDFRSNVMPLDKWSVGSCISTANGDGVGSSINASPSWLAKLAAIGPLSWRIPLKWNGGNPTSSAGGNQDNGGGAQWITNIKAMGGFPLVVVGGSTGDNDITPADAAALVHYFNDGGGQHGGRVDRWCVGNEPSNTASYLANLGPIIAAMKAADPTILVSAPAAANLELQPDHLGRSGGRGGHPDLSRLQRRHLGREQPVPVHRRVPGRRQLDAHHQARPAVWRPGVQLALRLRQRDQQGRVLRLAPAVLHRLGDRQRALCRWARQPLRRLQRRARADERRGPQGRPARRTGNPVPGLLGVDVLHRLQRAVPADPVPDQRAHRHIGPPGRNQHRGVGVRQRHPHRDQ